MRLSEMFPSSLLKAQDVTEAGGQMPLTIHAIEMREFDGDNGKQTKPVITFANETRMVVNKTNANIIAVMYGDDTDGWLNKEIILVVEDVPFQGKLTPAIRVKNVNSKQALIDAYWNKSRELGFTRPEGQDHLKQFGGDFKLALNALTNEPASADIGDGENLPY